MGKLRDRMEMDMKLRGLSPRTISSYLACMKNIAIHFKKSPAKLGEEEIRGYLHHPLSPNPPPCSFLELA